jgi:hypothetical protein
MTEVTNDAENPNKPLRINLGDAPSPYAVIHDHSKTVITLATAFLGLTVTFSERLIGSSPSMWQVTLLGTVWILLMISIVAAIVAVVQLYRFLSKASIPISSNDSLQKTQQEIDNRRAMALASSASYIILIIAGICFGVLGLTQFTNPHQELEAISISQKALEFMPSVYRDNNAKWQTIELYLDEQTNTYRVILREEKSALEFSLIFDAQQGRILQYRQLP